MRDSEAHSFGEPKPLRLVHSIWGHCRFVPRGTPRRAASNDLLLLDGRSETHLANPNRGAPDTRTRRHGATDLIGLVRLRCPKLPTMASRLTLALRLCSKSNKRVRNCLRGEVPGEAREPPRLLELPGGGILRPHQNRSHAYHAESAARPSDGPAPDHSAWNARHCLDIDESSARS